MKIRNLPNFGINSSFFLFILAFKFRIYNKKNQPDNTRSKTNNVGPISQREISKTYEDISGRRPGDATAIMIQRLPVLGRI